MRKKDGAPVRMLRERRLTYNLRSKKKRSTVQIDQNRFERGAPSFEIFSKIGHSELDKRS